MTRGLEQGRYIAMDVRSGMVLDLSGGDNRSVIAYRFHGSENQQARTNLPLFYLQLREILTGPPFACSP